jgi:hypothetical protein
MSLKPYQIKFRQNLHRIAPAFGVASETLAPKNSGSVKSLISGNITANAQKNT